MTTATISRQRIVDNTQSDFLGILDSLPAPLSARAFPVNGKRPAVKGWHRTNPRPATIAAYRARFSDANGCGLRTGLGPDGVLAVVDVDHPHELTEYQADVLESWPWAVATFRGWHCYGRPPLASIKTVKALPWGDFLASSAFVVAPGSAHTSGGRYMALPGFGQGALPTFGAELLESLLTQPDSFLTLSPDNAFPRERGDIGKRNELSTIFLGRLVCALGTAAAGQRNEALFAALRYWAYQQPQPDDLREWGAMVGQQAARYAALLRSRRNFPDSEIRKLGRSVTSWTWKKVFKRPALDSRLQAYRQVRQAETRRARNAGRDSQIVALHAAGLSYRAIGEAADVNKATAYRVVKRGGEIGATSAELRRALGVKDA